jgi:hypothetical protein
MDTPVKESVSGLRDFLRSHGKGEEWSDEQLGKALAVARERGKFSEDTDAAPGLMMIREDKWLEGWRDRDVDGNEYIRYGIVVSKP